MEDWEDVNWTRWRAWYLFVGEVCSGTVRKGACEGQCEISKKAKKDDLLNWPYSSA